MTTNHTNENALQESEERFRSAFEQTAVGMAFVAPDGKWLRVNQKLCEIIGYSKDELLGLIFQDITHPDDLEADLELARQVINDEIKTYTMEKRYIHKDRSIVWIDLTVSLIRLPSGEPKYFISVVQDISRRKQAEETLQKTYSVMEDKVKERTVELQKNQRALVNVLEDVNLSKKELKAANDKLKEMDRLKSIFIASMSHELRTPLNSVIGFSSVLMNEWAGPVNEEQNKLLQTISRSGKHLLSLINDVIDISKIESGKLDTHYEDFDLHDVISEAVDSINKDVADKKLSFNAEIPHLSMHSDRRRLLQCVLNLLSNAAKFTERGGVRVQARRVLNDVEAALCGCPNEGEHAGSPLQKDYIEISVEDTGIGIKEEDMPNLFGSFVRLDSPLRTIVPGTGLGLYLTRKLVRETLNGDIYAESTHGVGSRFTIRIPAKTEKQ